MIGQSTSNKLVKAVNTIRKVDIFASRLHPLTAENELVDCVNSVKGDLAAENVNCTKLKSKYEELYSSFRVEIKVNANDFKRAVHTFMSSESWPEGAFVKRYFRKQNGST